MAEPALRVTVSEFDRFMRQLSGSNSRSLTQIATGMGLPSTDNPGRSLALHLATARALDVGSVTDGEFRLSDAGSAFLSDTRARRMVISNTFRQGSLRDFYSNLCGRGHFVPLTQLDEAIALKWGRSNVRILRGLIKDWLEQSGLVQEGNDGLIISALPELAELAGASPRYASDARLYAHLLLHGFGDESGRLSRSEIEQKIAAFRNAQPDKSELPMKVVVSDLFECLGFTVQYRNGPREAARTNEKVKLDFGSQGDDLAVVLFQPFSSGMQEFVGLALAAELKRTSADKKSVTQALAVRDRLTEFHRSQILVLPIVISGDGSGRFSDAAARSYAHSSRVALLTIDQLVALVHEQKLRFKAGQDLILPVDLYVRIHTLVREGEVELYPTSLRFQIPDDEGPNAEN